MIIEHNLKQNEMYLLKEFLEIGELLQIVETISGNKIAIVEETDGMIAIVNLTTGEQTVMLN